MGMKRLIAATDFSEDSHRASRRAALIAAEQKASLSLLHVMSGPSLDSLRQMFPSPADAEQKLVEDSQRLLTELATELGDACGIAADAVVRIGRVVDEILSESEPADLLVLGAHGSNPLRDLILGSTAERLLRKRIRPTLVVKKTPEHSYRRVLIPVDFSPQSAATLSMAMALAPDAQYVIFHAFDIPFEGRLWLAGVPDEQIDVYRQQARQFSLNTLHELIRDTGADPARFEPVVALGEPSPLIISKERQLQPDLIIMGKHGRTAIEELLVGSVARHVLSTAECDVLVM